VDRSPRPELHGGNFRGLTWRRLPKKRKQQVDGVRQDIAQLFVSRQGSAAIRPPSEGPEGEETLHMHNRAKSRKQCASLEGGAFEEQLVAGTQLQVSRRRQAY
jgi:hypothetical protein